MCGRDGAVHAARVMHLPPASACHGPAPSLHTCAAPLPLVPKPACVHARTHAASCGSSPGAASLALSACPPPLPAAPPPPHPLLGVPLSLRPAHAAGRARQPASPPGHQPAGQLRGADQLGGRFQPGGLLRAAGQPEAARPAAQAISTSAHSRSPSGSFGRVGGLGGTAGGAAGCSAAGVMRGWGPRPRAGRAAVRATGGAAARMALMRRCCVLFCALFCGRQVGGGVVAGIA